MVTAGSGRLNAARLTLCGSRRRVHVCYWALGSRTGAESCRTERPRRLARLASARRDAARLQRPSATPPLSLSAQPSVRPPRRRAGSQPWDGVWENEPAPSHQSADRPAASATERCLPVSLCVAPRPADERAAADRPTDQARRGQGPAQHRFLNAAFCAKAKRGNR